MPSPSRWRWGAGRGAELIETKKWSKGSGLSIDEQYNHFFANVNCLSKRMVSMRCDTHCRDAAGEDSQSTFPIVCCVLVVGLLLSRKVIAEVFFS